MAYVRKFQENKNVNKITLAEFLKMRFVGEYLSSEAENLKIFGLAEFKYYPEIDKNGKIIDFLDYTKINNKEYQDRRVENYLVLKKKVIK